MGILDALRSAADPAADASPGASVDAAIPRLTPTREVLHQRLRVRRFLQASAFSLLYLAVLAIFAAQDRLDPRLLVQACAIVVVAILVFFALFRLGLNRRFGDPSLTGLQVLAAVGTMLFVVYQAPETRSIFAAFFFVALMFGMLGTGSLQLALLGTASLAGFAAVSLLRWHANHDGAMLRDDLLQLVVVAVAFPWLVFLGSRVKRLKEADRRKDDFLATLAHELRNPLAPIRTGIHILGMPAGAAEAERVLPMMARQVGHLARLLDDLLDVSRITRGKIALRIERVALADVVQAGIEASRPLIEQMEHVLAVSLPPAPVMLDADPVRLAQVLSNLLNNAARYTPPHGRIELAATVYGDGVEIRVRDNGLGIPAARLDSIFEMFAQSGASDTATPAGLGIGLSLVKGLVALHGGSVEARSDGHGRGSEFRVRLPLARGTLADAHETQVEPATARHKVLVVDDNRDVAASLATLIGMMGHEARTAWDGEEALEVAAAWHPDVALVDLGLPGIDGWETCRRLRARWGEAMRIVAVTGWGQEEDRRRSVAAGFDLHLVKPVDPAVLDTLLGTAVVPAKAPSE